MNLGSSDACSTHYGWHNSRDGIARRGGRAVDGSGLENRQGESPRGFESHPLRQPISDFRFSIFDLRQEPAPDKVGGNHSKKRSANHVGKMMRGDVHSRKSDQQRDC
jgi:hypothetical protein